MISLFFSRTLLAICTNISCVSHVCSSHNPLVLTQCIDSCYYASLLHPSPAIVFKRIAGFRSRQYAGNWRYVSESETYTKPITCHIRAYSLFFGSTASCTTNNSQIPECVFLPDLCVGTVTLHSVRRNAILMTHVPHDRTSRARQYTTELTCQ